ncbi:MAG: MerR family transcriptional regulator [Gemmatimonadota bacterium]|nr:MerR family transcriptional regulator [Gemmatimonadota bacterium]
MSADPEILTIGRLARAAGVHIETIRFYERRGLLPDPPRTRSGYRQYPPRAVKRLRFIRRAQGLGFTLDEIAELLELRVDEVAACHDVELRVRAKLRDVATKIAELRRIEGALERLVAACETREPTTDCPILEELDDRR